jgi:hypothetical protein
MLTVCKWDFNFQLYSSRYALDNRREALTSVVWGEWAAEEGPGG